MWSVTSRVASTVTAAKARTGKVDFLMPRARLILSEVWTALRRNLMTNIAAVLTFGIALTMVGVGLIGRSQVGLTQDFWYGSIELSLSLCDKNSTSASCAAGPVTPSQRTQIEDDLRALPQVEGVFYESKAAAYTRWKLQNPDSPLSQNISADALPESFRVKLRNPEADYDIVVSAVRNRPGVDYVVDQRNLLTTFFNLVGTLQWLAIVLAAASTVAALLLVGVVVLQAVISRRRETGIMRLVGASRLYIQIPFVLESMVLALLGAGIATLGLIGFKKWVLDGRFAAIIKVTPFVGWDTVVSTCITVAVGGLLVSAVAAMVTMWISKATRV